MRKARSIAQKRSLYSIDPAIHTAFEGCLGAGDWWLDTPINFCIFLNSYEVIVDGGGT